MSLFAKKLLAVIAAVAVVAGLIALYVADWATSFPKTVAATTAPVNSEATTLTLETVASAGKLSPTKPDWVTYSVRTKGRWVRSTDFSVPTNSLVHVTIYQFDSPTGLRNPFLSQSQGTVGPATLDGKPFNSIPAEEASHTFAVPELGVFVPLAGVPEEAKHPCEEGPCEPSLFDHRTITFSFRTFRKGRFRWQCFVPCAAGWYFGNGGPMQTLGYMDGFIDVV
ncbi:MAG TPA: hypothetical protein VGN08_10050 [Solirubrobacteraceae bacterium]